MTGEFQHRSDLIGIFAQHRVAANLMMLMMILAGVWGLSQLNTQFFPSFELDYVAVQVVWSGASAEDVEDSITNPLEREFRDLNQVRKMTSTSGNGVSAITLEYEEGTDMGEALDEVKQRVALVRNLPSDAEEPEVSRIIRYDSIARILITGDLDRRELRVLARAAERELLERGVAKIELEGLPEEEIAIQIPSAVLEEIGMSFSEVAGRVAQLSQDLPAGSVGQQDTARQLRSLDQRRDVAGFARLTLKADEQGRRITLGDVAQIERRPQDREVRITFRGQPAVELHLLRSEAADALDSARILQQWAEQARPQLPPGIELHVFDQSWQLIRDRLGLLLKNGGGGLVLVVGILFLFLNARVAIWVAIGIPVSFMATLGVLYVLGGSINMISLFALIMALGIIVDDAIVVGEDALAHYQGGERSLEAAEGGARRMLAPVSASSLTTIAAFVPIMSVGGVIGNIIFDIPLIIVCVILASLVESFLILPGHLRHSFHKMHHAQPGRLRAWLDGRFFAFRDRVFRPLVTRAVAYRWTTIAAALGSLILTFGLLAGGRVGFTFFPVPEGSIINASAAFVSGTDANRVARFMGHLEQTLAETEVEFGGDLVVAAKTRLGKVTLGGGSTTQEGEQFGSMVVELTASDTREVRLNEFIRAWQARVSRPAGLETFAIFPRQAGPPGRDIEVRLAGEDAERVKRAALELAETLQTFDGVSAIEDDTPYGREQYIYRLTPQAEAMGLTVEAVGRQLRSAYDGSLVQIFQDGEEEVEVRVSLPDAEQNSLASLDSLNVSLGAGGSIPLSSAVYFETRRGFEAIRHADGKLAVQVSGDVDAQITSSDDVLASLEASVLPELVTRYGVRYSFEGRAADQAETMADMRRGALFALAFIYLILAWVFASYSWPIVVMLAIPLGLVGAIVGHYVMGIKLTILSMFGMFGLSGIVINDSIVLVTFYRQLRQDGMIVQEAIIEAACQRLRAVLLTSLTTIGGLTPLLFETSLQAQFLIPMAVSISFGLAFTTFIVLFFVPAVLSVNESITHRLDRMRGRTAQFGSLQEGKPPG
jgi:multidrug efflux pump subunit AcrB